MNNQTTGKSNTLSVLIKNNLKQRHDLQNLILTLYFYKNIY